MDMNKNVSQLPRFRARAVFVDFENTLIVRRATGRRRERDGLMEALSGCVMERSGMDRGEAEGLVREASRNFHLPLEVYSNRLGLEAEEVRGRVLQWLREDYRADPGAAPVLEHFRKSGLKLWPATTNSGFFCGLKLEAVGLGTVEANPFFEELRGGSEVHPLGKMTSGFFRNLLERAGVAAAEAVHIGDQAVWDRDVPFGAGIRQVILLDRTLSEPAVEGKDGEIYARSWRAIRNCVVALE